MTRKIFCGATILLMSAGMAVRAEDGAVGKPDAQMKAVLDELAAMNGKPIETLTPDEARRQPTPADAVMRLLKKQGKDKPEEVGAISEITVAGMDGNRIPLRTYTPKGERPADGWPVLVYYHGGGFVIATLDTYDASCRALCNAAGCVVVSVEYRKAPENKYPAAVNDAFAAYEWVVKNTKEVKGDSSKIAIGGESAGGNLATVTCMQAKEKNVALPVMQLLVYPVVNDDMTTASYQMYADAKPLNKGMMGWFFGHYLPDPKVASDAHVTPLKAKDVSFMPPTLVIGAEIDPLMTEGKQYADKLQSANVSVDYKIYRGVTHEFFGMGAAVDKAKEAEADAGAALKVAFGKGVSGRREAGER